MVWAVGPSSEELNQLYGDLQNSLGAEKRPYSLHITLGRIRSWDFKRINPEERPIIKEDVALSFRVASIEVMESQLKPTGAQYTILNSWQLK